MSGIYGFSCRTPEASSVRDALDALRRWNQIFGRDAHDQRMLADSGIGCHIEHFSDKFSYGGPVLEYNGGPAVIDALLYNRDELIEDLGISAVPLSDEALLLELIRLKGFEALATVNGDFAGAIFDERSGEWILFRDHFGVRPLYVYLDDRWFAFSTDLRGLLALPNADPRIDESQIYARLSGANYLSLQRTDFAHISLALPAAVTRIKRTDNGFVKTEQIYWRTRQKRIRYKTDADYQNALRELITDAVNRRCDAIPGLLGAELSGGYDSGIIDILISRHGRKCCFYSWSHDPEDLPLRDGTDERKVILDICAQENIECRFYKRQDSVDFSRKAEKAVPPFVDTTQLSYGSAWIKSQGANVVFTGHAGDEGVSHRASRFELLYNHEYLAYFKLFWEDAKGRKLRFLRALKWALQDAFARIKELNDPEYGYANFYPVLRPEFRERMQKVFDNKPLYFNYAPHRYVMNGGTRPRLENAAYQGAVNGVRYLFPYVDHRVFDFSLSIPRRLYITHDRNRVIFREAFRSMIPQSLYDVDYKDSASRRDLRKKVNASDKDSVKSYLTYFMEQIDRDLWSDMLDFDSLTRLMTMDKQDLRREGMSNMILMELSRCLAVQHLLEEVQNRRENDERDKETV